MEEREGQGERDKVEPDNMDCAVDCVWHYCHSAYETFNLISKRHH